uniref:Serpentine receptor class gamma n=1 Tax=Panagrolaimus superbus TaxID=310955 RepID=A0A914Y1L0_9BILA
MLQYGLQKKRIVEIRLAFCGISLFVVLLLNNIVQLMTCYGAYFNSRNINLIVNDLSYPVIDLLYSITPSALIFTSTEIQRQLTPCIPRTTSPRVFLVQSGIDNRTTTTNFRTQSNIVS